MEQKSVVVKKGSDSDKQRYVRKSRFQREGKEPAIEQTQSEVGKKSWDSDKASIRLKEQIPAKRKGTSHRADTVRSQQKGTGLQRMGVKRSDAEGGTEMDAV